ARIILIADEHCRWYLDSRFGHDPSRIRERMMTDLRRVHDGLQQKFSNRKVDLYYASLGEDGSASFEAV
ncbi:MAG: hypothetical protein ACREB3_14255, partial [Burkholderiales bacterium]